MATKNLGRVTGKSAYEVWLAQGNTGSEQDFLNSLKADVEVPTKLSELDNDKGFVTENDIPTKTSQLTNDSNFINAETDPKYTADKPNIALKSEIPTKVSDLTNDSKYLTSYTESDPKYTADKPNIALKIEIPTKTSQLTNDNQFVSESYVKNAIAEAELSGGDVDLTGLATKDDLLGKVDKETGKSLVADTEILRLSTVDNYDDTEIKQDINDINQALDKKAEKTEIPTVPTKVSELTNDSGFITGYTETDPQYNADKSKIALKSEIPTKVSQLTNDSKYLTSYTETDPTVPSWAKATTKPSYTKSEVGLGNVENVKQYSASNPPPYPVTSVNGNTGAVTVSVPTSTSDLANDSGFITNAELEKLTLGINPADGFVYIYKDGKIIGSGIEMGATGESIGYVDVATNTIIINTSLGEGTYVVQYEMEEGDPVYIGELVVDNTVRYLVTNNLTKCSTNNSATQVIGGESYTAVISPDTGHLVDSITVIMGGNDITSTAVEGNTISIDSVDGAIEITATAVEQSVVDTYTITNNLTNCSNSNSTAQLESGKSYSATISTTPAYALSSLKVVMAGVDISSTAITKTATGATISIASVTGNVTITASAVENLIAKALDFTYANSTWTLSSNVLKDTSVTPNTIGYKTGYNTSSSTGVESPTSGSEITGFIPVKYGDTIRIKNIATTENNRINVQCYKGTTANGVTTLTYIAATTLYSGFITRGTYEGNGVRSMVLTSTHNNKFTASAGITHMKFSSTDINNNSVITVNKEII